MTCAKRTFTASTGTLLAVYTWTNGERALVLIPHLRAKAPWYVVMEPADVVRRADARPEAWASWHQADQRAATNKGTLLEYGYAVLGCVNWDYLNAKRLIVLTIFAINVGKAGACGSQAVLEINAGNVLPGCDLLARTPSGAPNWRTSAGMFRQGLQNRR